jgi:hypothetical protein
MIFASDRVFADTSDETEPIYQDEVLDGIAHGAKEQADAWMMAAEEEQDTSNTQFVKDLLALTARAMKKRDGARAGEMGTVTRLQPRHQKGRSADYDRVCAEHAKREVAKFEEVKSRHKDTHARAEAEQEKRLAEGLSEEVN